MTDEDEHAKLNSLSLSRLVILSTVYPNGSFPVH